MRSYYGSRAPGQMQGIVTRPCVGINEYTPPTALNDNYLTDMLDAEPHKEEAIKLYAKASSAVNGLITTAIGTATGTILAAIGDHPVGDDPSIIMLNYLPSTTTWYIRRVDMDDYGIGEFFGSPGGFVLGSYDTFDCALFKTEAKNYVVFTNSAVKTLLWFDYTTSNAVTLPFYPKRIVTHANRLFAIDTGNKLWWCRAGDFFTWYSLAYDDDALMASTDMANAAYTLSAQPAKAGVITATVTATSTADTMGTLALVGTYNGVSQSETLTPVAGQRVQSVKTYDANGVTSITGSGWTAAAGADKITFGVGPAGGYVQDDAGYWTVEKERDLLDLEVIGNVLYIFSASHIYAFSGYSPDTFTLQLSITDIGLIKEGLTISDLTQANNRLYFISGSDVYEFDGSSAPRVISRPILVNNALTNGVMGGIEMDTSIGSGFDQANHWRLTADKTNLYVYIRESILDVDTFRYEFNFKTRTWWKRSVPNHLHASVIAPYKLWYVPMYNRTDVYTVVNSYHTGDYTFQVFDDKGFTHDDYPYIITKAYNTNPSELGTLTTLILMLSGTAGETADITVLYSLTTNADDFVELYHEEDYLFTGDVETIEIPVPVSAIANAHHYRLKIISEGNVLYLYNIERRFRVRGRSR